MTDYLTSFIQQLDTLAPSSESVDSVAKLEAFGHLTSEHEVMDALLAELREFENHEVIRHILDQGKDLKKYKLDVENRVQEVELESIHDYISEADHLVELYEEIKSCDGILEHMETLLGKFQFDLGNISEKINELQGSSAALNMKLNNRRKVQAKLQEFIDDIAVPPTLIQAINGAEVDEKYVSHLMELQEKLDKIAMLGGGGDALAVRDASPVCENLRIRAVQRVREFLLAKVYQLRKPRTNIQMLQVNVLLKFTPLCTFLRKHGHEVYDEVRAAYIEGMSRTLSFNFRQYLEGVHNLNADVLHRGDVIGVDDSPSTSSVLGLFQRVTNRARRDDLFVLGQRVSVIDMLTKQAIVLHVAESKSEKYPYEYVFGSIQKLLMDTTKSEYTFCRTFFHDTALFDELMAPVIQIIEGDLQKRLVELHDIISVLLMIRINHINQLVMNKCAIPALDSYLDRVNILLWPRFQALFDAQLASIRAGKERSLFNNSTAPHPAARHYADLTVSLLQLNHEYGNPNVNDSIERLKATMTDMLLRLSHLFSNKRLGNIFLTTNYFEIQGRLLQGDRAVIHTLPSTTPDSQARGLGTQGAAVIKEFEEQYNNSASVYVEDALSQHFHDMLNFVRKGEVATRSTSGWKEGVKLPGYGPKEAASVFADFKMRWERAIATMANDVQVHFGDSPCSKNILKRCLVQMLLYYQRLQDLLRKQGPEGLSVLRDAVPHQSVAYHLKQFDRQLQGN